MIDLEKECNVSLVKIDSFQKSFGSGVKNILKRDRIELLCTSMLELHAACSLEYLSGAV